MNHGGCPSEKTTVCKKTRFRHPDKGLCVLLPRKQTIGSVFVLGFVGARQKGDSKWEKPVSAKICGFCGFLRKSAVSCGFLRKSATPKSLDLQSEPKISENLQKSAKMCVPGPVSPFCCLPWSTLAKALAILKI